MKNHLITDIATNPRFQRFKVSLKHHKKLPTSAQLANFPINHLYFSKSSYGRFVIKLKLQISSGAISHNAIQILTVTRAYNL